VIANLKVLLKVEAAVIQVGTVGLNQTIEVQEIILVEDVGEVKAKTGVLRR